jgi:hypothetical protein
MTTEVNFEIEQGSTFLRTMSVIDNNNTPVDLTTYTLAGQLRRSYSSSEFIDFDIVILNPVLGRIAVSLTGLVTATLTHSKYVFDVNATNADDVILRIMEGLITVSPNVTR